MTVYQFGTDIIKQMMDISKINIEKVGKKVKNDFKVKNYNQGRYPIQNNH
jgi:hypothetical protein